MAAYQLMWQHYLRRECSLMLHYVALLILCDTLTLRTQQQQGKKQEQQNVEGKQLKRVTTTINTLQSAASAALAVGTRAFEALTRSFWLVKKQFPNEGHSCNNRFSDIQTHTGGTTCVYYCAHLWPYAQNVAANHQLSSLFSSALLSQLRVVEVFI